MIDYEFVIKPILVRVCGESVFGLNYNNSLSLWNFDEYFLKCRVRTSAHKPSLIVARAFQNGAPFANAAIDHPQSGAASRAL
jgi:hypothetical protein